MATEDSQFDRLDPLAAPVSRAISIIDANGKEWFEVEAVSGQEAVSRPFEFFLRLRRLASVGKPPQELLGIPLAIRWQVGTRTTRVVSGVFCEFARTSQRGRYRRYEAVFVPPIWPLTQNRNCRIFQDRTVPEILEELLRAYVAEFRWQRQEPYDQRPQCVQYMESDFDFAQRLMEEEGIHYFFDPGRKGMLVIADVSHNNPPIPDPKQLRVRDVSGQIPDSGCILQLDVVEQAIVPKVRLVDHCFQMKQSRSEAVVPCGPPKSERGPQVWKDDSFESYGIAAHHFDAVGSDGKPRGDIDDRVVKALQRQTQLRAELFACSRKRLLATSDVWHIAPGFQFELTNAGGNDDGDYLRGRLKTTSRFVVS